MSLLGLRLNSPAIVVCRRAGDPTATQTEKDQSEDKGLGTPHPSSKAKGARVCCCLLQQKRSLKDD